MEEFIDILKRIEERLETIERLISLNVQAHSEDEKRRIDEAIADYSQRAVQLYRFAERIPCNQETRQYDLVLGSRVHEADEAGSSIIDDGMTYKMLRLP